MLINLSVVIISQCICISKHHVAHFIFVLLLFSYSCPTFFPLLSTALPPTPTGNPHGIVHAHKSSYSCSLTCALCVNYISIKLGKNNEQGKPYRIVIVPGVEIPYLKVTPKGINSKLLLPSPILRPSILPSSQRSPRGRDVPA